jgi:hypothetical protein
MLPLQRSVVSVLLKPGRRSEKSIVLLEEEKKKLTLFCLIPTVEMLFSICQASKYKTGKLEVKKPEWILTRKIVLRI